MTAHLTQTMRDSVVRLLLAMADNRGDEVAEVLIEIGDRSETSIATDTFARSPAS